jgi:HK97 family phage major capsid protein
MRDFVSGAQTLLWSQGPVGGYTVPFAYDSTLREAMAQTDPLFSSDVTSFTMTPTPTLQPEQVSGFDLSAVSGQLVGESQRQAPQVIPVVAGATLRCDLIWKATFVASWEAEMDIPSFGEKITRAAGVALTRRLGQSVVSGRGGSDILGVTRSLSPSLSNGTAGKITLTDINNFFFGVDRWYRSQPKCAWLVTDGCYKFLRNAVDSQNRPFLNVERDGETLLGKPVYISPSLGSAYSSIGLQGALIFGDLASIVIRASRPTIERSIESGPAITNGEFLWIGRVRCDAVFFDPSAGSNPPLVMAAIS